MDLADRVRQLLKQRKPGYGDVDTDASSAVVNRSDARRYLRGRGPFQRFMADTPATNSPHGEGRSRKKRALAIRRARGLEA